MSKERNSKSFQARLDELSGIVQSLDGGELSLEESVARFEQGRSLHQELLAELASYEQRLEKLSADNDAADGDGNQH